MFGAAMADSVEQVFFFFITFDHHDRIQLQEFGVVLQNVSRIHGRRHGGVVAIFNFANIFHVRADQARRFFPRPAVFFAMLFQLFAKRFKAGDFFSGKNHSTVFMSGRRLNPNYHVNS